MPKFGHFSLRQLVTCDDRLKLIANTAIEYVDFKVIKGHRTWDEQQIAYEQGFSKLKPGESKHNNWKSAAFDFAPWPIDWNDVDRFVFIGGILLGIAHCNNIKLRLGFDWNMNSDFKDETFLDYGHVELID